MTLSIGAVGQAAQIPLYAYYALPVLPVLAVLICLPFRRGRAFLLKVHDWIYRSGNFVIWIGRILMAILAAWTVWYVLTHGVLPPTNSVAFWFWQGHNIPAI